MNVPFIIAKRYFFSKSKQNLINVINAIALTVVVVATAALFVVLSAFSGLKSFGLSFTSAFDPDYRVETTTGKILHLDSLALQQLREEEGVLGLYPVLEEKVFLNFKEKSQVAFLKGVDKNYTDTFTIQSSLVSGQWFNADFDELVLGGGIASNLSVGVYDYSSFLTLSAPRRKKTSLLGEAPFVQQEALVSGIFLAAENLDKKYLFSNLSFAQKLLQRKATECSYLEMKVASSFQPEEFHKKAQALLKQDLVLKSKNELNAALYKMLNTENAAVYLIFTLVMIIAFFNVIGALIMMFLDKKPQLNVLYAMGVPPLGIQRIFLYNGLFISAVGGVIGLGLGILLVALQDRFALLYVPATSLPYPVEFHIKNVLIVFFTLSVLGLLASTWATQNMAKKIR